MMALLALSALAEPAYAYVDPSVMTYTIQALAGVAVALSAVAGVAFRRSRRAIMKALNIDENAKKDIDPQWLRVAAASENVTYSSDYFAEQIAVGERMKEGASKRQHADQDAGQEPVIWRKRFALGLIIALFCSVTLFITAPFEIVAGAASDLKFSIYDIWWIMALFACFSAVVLALAVSLFRGKAFTVALTLMFCFGLACYLQAAFLNVGLPEADGRTVGWWEDHAIMMVVSALVWVAILVVPAIACVKNRKMSHIVAVVLSVALIVVQGVGVASLFVSGTEKRSVAITEDGLFEVSSKNNVIVFVLDCYDTKVFEKVLDEDAAMLDEMDGFTWYRDSSGEMIPTNFAVPYLLTGEVPQVDESVSEYLVRRYTDSTFLEDLNATNYSVGLYTDTFGLSYLDDEMAKNEVFDNAINLHPLSEAMPIDVVNTIRILARCSFSRDMPWVFKPRFWFYTDELNQRVIARTDSSDPAETLYYIDDSWYHERLEQKGLSVSDKSYDGAFRFIHLEGAHYPYSIDENGWYIGVDNSDQMRQARGSMRIVGEYLRQLKDLGLYDDATIIVTSDHGDWYPSMEFPTETTEPILLYKSSNSETAEGLAVSNAQVSHADFHGTVLSAIGADASKYGPPYEQIPEDAQRTRTFFHILHDQNAHIHGLLEYEIKGSVLDFSNWTYTGHEWETDYNNNLH